MRTGCLVLLLCLLICLAGCFEEQSAWVYGNPESQGMAGVRLGTEVVENLEIGAAVNYSPGESSTTTVREKGKSDRKRRGRKTIIHEHEDDWTYGVYGLLHFPDVIKGISPYAGAQATIGNGGDDVASTIQPLGGINIGLSESASLFSEYQLEATNGEKDKILFGVRFRF